MQHQLAQVKLVPGCLRPQAIVSYVPRVSSALENIHLILFTQLQSEAATDLGKVQRAFDVDAVMSAVDGALESRSSQADQINAVGRRKSVDKVLRQVLNDVILVEDRLRELAPDKVALTRWVACTYT